MNVQDFKLKEFEVKDGRVLARFLVKTGLKKTLFGIMFPKDNRPKNWPELRIYLQTTYGMSDAEFRDMRNKYDGNLEAALMYYREDFSDTNADFGEVLVDVLIDVFADDMKYNELMALIAHLFQTDVTELDNLSIKDAVELVRKLVKDSGFLALWQQSTPVTETEAASTSQ